MVVRIKSPHSLKRALNYNEQKVQKGDAKCIHAENYLLAASKMNFHEKLERLQDLMALNQRATKSNSLHISLNFDPSEKLNESQLIRIAGVYMDKIGFAAQPYLVYSHHDAGHPHIHIVTTSIQQDGKRIDTFNIGRNQSEKARKDIENSFGLVKAENSKAKLLKDFRPIDVQKIQYGKTETKRAITSVLDAVIPHFKYSSLMQLNAVLKLYNVVADRGSENSVTYAKGGLTYRILDANGNKVGVPIKASSIYNKPVLKELEKRFAENETFRQPERKRLKTTLDWILSRSPKNLKDIIDALQKEKVHTILRENKEVFVYGITFVDFRTRSVFNGSDLGKEYSIASLQKRMAAANTQSDSRPFSTETKSMLREKEQPKQFVHQEPKTNPENSDSPLKDLLDAEKQLQRTSPELLRKKNKKRNRNL